MAHINEYHCRSCENVWYSRQWSPTHWEPACEDEPQCPECGAHRKGCDCPECVLQPQGVAFEDATSDVCHE